jgi:cytochrome c-type biogenesis protein CcmH
VTTLSLVLSLVLTQGYAPQRQGLDPLEAEKEARVMRLGKQLRCAVCQGVSIADSPASMARAQLDKVRELVAEGKSDDEIYTYFIERYGEWVLLEPTKGGLNAVLWVGPLALLGLGLVVIVLQSKRKQPATVAAAAPVEPTATATADDALLAQVRADLEK